MTPSFSVIPIDKGITRYAHHGSFTREDVRALVSFLGDFHGKLLVDLTGTTGKARARHVQQCRPMMPVTAIFGSALDPKILEIPESYYTHAVRYFKSEEEALAWLRNQ